MPRFEGGNNYNSRGNDHPGFHWSDPSGGQQQNYRSDFQGQQNAQYKAPFQPKPTGPSTEDMLKSLTQHFTDRKSVV